MSFDLIIFDMDGVLIDSEVLSCTALMHSLSEIGLVLPFDEVIERFLGCSFSVVEDHYARETHQSLPNNFRAALRARLFDEFQRSLRPMAGASEMLKRASQPFCLASSSDAERIAFSLSVTQLGGFFGQRVFNRAMVVNGKPAPDLFLHAARAMRAAPERTLVLEDSVNGVKAGKAAGMTVWGFTGGSHHVGRPAAETLRKAGADQIFSSLDAVLPEAAESARG